MQESKISELTKITSSVERALLDFYNLIAENYERFNTILTLGLANRWRKKLVLIARKGSPKDCLDVCTGTGEIAILLKKFLPEAKITGLDFSPAMLAKALEKHDLKGISFVLGNAEKLPFKDESFDLVTLSLAARNLNVENHGLKQSFLEFGRVLKKGGVFLNLETSQPENAFIRKLFHLYIRVSIWLINRISPCSRMPYSFLENTALNFYGSKGFSKILIEAGFKNISVDKMVFGAVVIHKAVKS